jgi:hypothetical protein
VKRHPLELKGQLPLSLTKVNGDGSFSLAAEKSLAAFAGASCLQKYRVYDTLSEYSIQLRRVARFQDLGWRSGVHFSWKRSEATNDMGQNRYQGPPVVIQSDPLRTVETPVRYPTYVGSRLNHAGTFAGAQC